MADRDRKKGDLQVLLSFPWEVHVRLPTFIVDVRNITEARKILEVLAAYDAFRFENNVKPSYRNVRRIDVWDGGEWIEYDENSAPF